MKKRILALAPRPVRLPRCRLPGSIPAQAASSIPALGDLAPLEKIASDTLALVQRNDLTAAGARITDFENAWDEAEPKLYPMDHDRWGFVDDAADSAISALRAAPPSQDKAQAAVAGLITALKNPAGQ